MPDRTLPRLVIPALLALVAVTPTATAAHFDLAEDAAGPAVTVASAAPADWSRARLFPAAVALAAVEARRDAAAANATLESLRPGPDGVVDLSLSTVLDLTLRNNLELLVDSYDPAIAIESVRAREAIYDPLLRFTVGLLSSTNPTSATLEGASILTRKNAVWNAEAEQLLPWGGVGQVGFTNERNRSNNVFSTLNPSFDSNLTFALSQPLLRNFGRDATRRQIDISQANREQSQERFREQVMSKVTDAIGAYWLLYGRREQLGVQKAGLELANDLLRINRTRVEVGTMAPLDISLAEAEVARNEELVIAAQGELGNAEDVIRQLINVPRASTLWTAELRPVDAPVIDERAGDVDVAIDTAYRHRPEMRRQELQNRIRAVELRYARNQLRPALDLQASYGVGGLGGTQVIRGGPDDMIIDTVNGGYGDALDQLFSFDFDTWRVGLTLAFPVFNQLAEANYAAALLEQRRGEDERELLRQQVAVEVRRLARAVETSRKRTEAARATRTLQEKRLDAESKKFEHGLSTNFEVQQAQKDLTEARSNEVLAITEYRISLAALERATGTVLQSHGVRIEE